MSGIVETKRSTLNNDIPHRKIVSKRTNILTRCRKPIRLKFKSIPLALWLLCCLVFSSSYKLSTIAEDSAAPPALDIGALAGLASNLGSNPQIMSMVTGLLNSNAPQKPNAGMPAAGPSGQVDLSPPSGGVSDQDPNSAVSQDNGVALRRGTQQDAITNDAAADSVQQQAPTGIPLNGLLSMVPGVLSSLGASSGSGGLAGSLGSLLGLNKPNATNGSGRLRAAVQTASRTDLGASPSDTQQQTETSFATAASSAGVQKNPLPLPATLTATAGASLAPQSAQATQTIGASPAQSVINQVLTAYAAGQIPNELIQLGLSGRVPPQIIELALSGQVPPQMIQMVITGQVPMSVINAFLGTMQSSGFGGGAMPVMPTGLAMSPAGEQRSQTGRLFGDGIGLNVFSTTRNLFEALFGLNRNRGGPQQEGAGSKATSMLGPFPLRMPSLPNVRSIGQLVGGTITNVSSMIPF